MKNFKENDDDFESFLKENDNDQDKENIRFEKVHELLNEIRLESENQSETNIIPLLQTFMDYISDSYNALAFKKQYNVSELLITVFYQYEDADIIDSAILAIIRWIAYQDYDNENFFQEEFMNFLISILQNESIVFEIRMKTLCLIQNLSIRSSILLKFMIENNYVNILENYFTETPGVEVNPIPYILSMLIDLRYPDIDLFKRYLQSLEDSWISYTKEISYLIRKFITAVENPVETFLEVFGQNFHFSELDGKEDALNLFIFLCEVADSQIIQLFFDNNDIPQLFDESSTIAEKILVFQLITVATPKLNEESISKIFTEKFVSDSVRLVKRAQTELQRSFITMFDTCLNCFPADLKNSIINKKIIHVIIRFLITEDQETVEYSLKSLLNLLNSSTLNFSNLTNVDLRSLDMIFDEYDFKDVFEEIESSDDLDFEKIGPLINEISGCIDKYIDTANINVKYTPILEVSSEFISGYEDII
ncbi:hypothetical protein TVAG_051870 [Trichomonas vaginalis G3]|uniref:Uncharacterized protein n=1 Tax=Trichomonas vaginalis (strain ATCC PRA-98 / G3) TaxID=412133 RepID=A2FIJ4_TRIV3|nr:armadillo (ARM) repeat-containing protein family [Trichomonas vaginalis G3]EAX95275.1 hypothetical protein TVAG_051870 [Trichomonas vaginalis G3]KAI5504612.1 armadillo (ARM) repeat-containing protein family [Trichomonas vaginalis G3]|eukprot:XP_001308205.1 hypothetical protein [Trichomonas vaginalis G3]